MKKEASPSELARLISGMTRLEKSAYRKEPRRSGAGAPSLSLQLFEALLEHPGAADPALAERLGIHNKTQYSGVKAELHKDVLDAMVLSRRERSVNSQLHFMNEQISLLLIRRLYGTADKLCRKAILLAERYGKYHDQVSLLYRQSQILAYRDYKRHSRQAAALFAHIQEVFHLQQELQYFQLLYEQVKIMTYRTWLRISERELEEIARMQAGLLEREAPPGTHPLIALFRFNTLALCQYMLHDHTGCTKTCRDMLGLWKRSPHLIAEYPALFISTVNTTAYNDFLCKDIAAVESHIRSYERLAADQLKDDPWPRIFDIFRFNTWLKVFHKKGQYDKVEQWVDTHAEAVLRHTEAFLSPPDALSVPTSVCISYFVLERWDEAESLLIAVKEKNRSINREDILYFSLLFHLLILYEKKEWPRLESTIDSTYHFLYARQRLRPFERELLLFMRRLSAARSPGEQKPLITRFLEQQSKLRESERQLYTLYFNFFGWLDSIREGLPYREYVRRSLQQVDSLEEVLP